MTAITGAWTEDRQAMLDEARMLGSFVRLLFQGGSGEGADTAVINANPRHLIFRTAWVFGPYGDNFWLSLRIVCMDVRWRLRGKPGVRRSPVQAVGIIAGSCRDIWSRRLGSAAGNPSTGHVGC